MSQYPTGQMGPTSAVRQRRVSDNDPRVGQTESLGVFGVTPTTAIDDRGVNSARALMAALGVVDRSLAVSAQEVRQQRDDAEREAEKNERLFRGIGAERTIEVGPQLLEDVRTGKIRPNEGEDYAAFADRIIRERAALPDDDAATPIAIDEMRKRLSTGLQNEAIRLVNEESDRQRKEMSSLIVSGAAGKSADELRAAIAELRTINPDASEEALRDTVATASLQVAALQGNEAAFKEAASLLPENSADVARYSVSLRERLREREGMAVNALDSRIAGMYVDEQPFSAIRESIASARGSVPDEVIERKLRELDGREAATMREAAEKAATLYNADIEARLIDEAATSAVTAFDSGGLLGVKDQEWTDPLGRTVRISAEEQRRRAVDKVFADIDKQGLTPAQAINEKSAILAYNGYKYQPWSSVLEAGPAASIQAFTAMREGKPVTELPKNLSDGYSLYKTLAATNPAVLAMHASEDTSRLYSMAQLAETYIDKGDEKAALLRAMQADGRKSFGAITNDQVADRVDDWIKGAANSQDMYATVQGVANLLLKSGVVPDSDTAVKEASKMVKASHRKINGAYVNVQNRSVPPNIEVIGDKIINDYFAKYGEEEGVSKKNLTLVPMPGSSDGWMLYNRATLSPVEQDGQWLYRTSDLADIARKMQEEEVRVAGQSLQTGNAASQRINFEDRMIAAALGFAERPRVTRNGLETFTPPRPRTDPFAE